MKIHENNKNQAKYSKSKQKYLKVKNKNKFSIMLKHKRNIPQKSSKIPRYKVTIWRRLQNKKCLKM